MQYFGCDPDSIQKNKGLAACFFPKEYETGEAPRADSGLTRLCGPAEFTYWVRELAHANSARTYATCVSTYANSARTYAKTIRAYAKAIRAYAKAIRAYAKTICTYAKTIRACGDPA